MFVQGASSWSPWLKQDLLIQLCQRVCRQDRLEAGGPDVRQPVGLQLVQAAAVDQPLGSSSPGWMRFSHFHTPRRGMDLG